MINCFKLTKRLYWFVLVPAFVGMIIFLPFFIDSLFLPFFISIPVFYVGAILIQTLAVKKYKEYEKLIEDECDPEAFLNFQIEMMSKNIGKNYRLQVQLNMASAYFYCGDFEGMKYTLNSIYYKSINYKSGALRFNYWYKWFSYYIKLNELQSAENVLSELDALLESSNEIVKKSQKSIVESKHLSLKSHKEEIPDIEKKLAVYTLPDNIFYKVTTKDFLGNYYLRYGNTDKAKECFEFVVQNGNKLYMVKEAELKLKELKKEK